jgi:predicted ABC-type transport system involved in lysophospholipase L1 biosynthesis ATPase subunit
VPQDLALYEDLSALENLKLFGALYGLKGAQLKQRCEQVLALVNLSDRAGDAPSSFSGGMKRRLNIAAALLHEPQLLILDEPTVGVDPQSRNAIFDTLEALQAQGRADLHQPLHGGGGAAGRPHRHHRPRQGAGRRNPGRAVPAPAGAGGAAGGTGAGAGGGAAVRCAALDGVTSVSATAPR